MRRILIALVVAPLALAGCGGDSTSNPSTSGSTTAESCDPSSLPTLEPGTLTVGTDNPVFQPWFAGAKGSGKPPWKADPNNGTGNPYSDQGYESEAAYGIAEQLGYTKDQVRWVAVPFNNSYKPGPKDFDFYIGQVSYSNDRAQAVEFSDGYYNVQQALVANKGTPLASATTFADLKDAKLGVQIATTSYAYIVNEIKPSQKPAVYDNSTDVIAALNAGQVDGYLVDAPDAYVNVLIGQAKHGVVVGQFPTIHEQEYFGVIFAQGSSLVGCVNDAIAALHSDGTLDALEQQWLKDVTFPVITP
jgi:polar amino acid transport system substrate-binding protein